MDKNYIDEVVEELADGYYFHSGFSRDDFDKKIKDLTNQVEQRKVEEIRKSIKAVNEDITLNKPRSLEIILKSLKTKE